MGRSATLSAMSAPSWNSTNRHVARYSPGAVRATWFVAASSKKARIAATPRLPDGSPSLPAEETPSHLNNAAGELEHALEEAGLVEPWSIETFRTASPSAQGAKCA